MISFLLLVFGGLVLFYLGFQVHRVSTRQIDREIGRNIAITPEWTELTPQPPLKAKHPTQSVLLYIEGYESDHIDVHTSIILPDGTALDPEVQLIDEYGKVFPLKISQWLPGGVGFSKDKDAGSRSTFPQDRLYTKVRIRTDKPFGISAAYWECYRPLK